MSVPLLLCLFVAVPFLSAATPGGVPAGGVPGGLGRAGGDLVGLPEAMAPAAPAAPAEGSPGSVGEAGLLPPNPPAPPVPVDGGLGLLALAGGAYATRRLRGRAARAAAFVLLAGTLAGALAGGAHAQALRPEVYATNGTVSATAVSADGPTL
jgi:hypothetical protein